MQKQTVMQAELDAVKPGDFADATTDEVMPGVEVIIAARSGERRYVILGEWDNDLELGIISSQTRVAKNLMGKKAGDKFELPDVEGNVELASVKEILPLSDEVKSWMKIR
jgi:transcription elongation GreA/GreB family factor